MRVLAFVVYSWYVDWYLSDVCCVVLVVDCSLIVVGGLLVVGCCSLLVMRCFVC